MEFDAVILLVQKSFGEGFLGCGHGFVYVSSLLHSVVPLTFVSVPSALSKAG